MQTNIARTIIFIQVIHRDSINIERIGLDSLKRFSLRKVLISFLNHEKFRFFKYYNVNILSIVCHMFVSLCEIILK